MPRTQRASFVLLALASFVSSACYGSARPSYHPGEARDIVAAIARQGVTVGDVLPGASACDDAGLVGNALQLTVTDPADGSTRDLWVYSFRERYWDASGPQVDACQAAFVAAHPGAVVRRLDIPLYRAFGAGWSAELTNALEAAIAEAAGAGGS